eukprot:12294657-Heterocapsa_arctica.AAC.1
MVALAARITGYKAFEEAGFIAGNGARTEQAINPGTVLSPQRLFRRHGDRLGRFCDRGKQRISQGVDGNFVQDSRAGAM